MSHHINVSLYLDVPEEDSGAGLGRAGLGKGVDQRASVYSVQSRSCFVSPPFFQLSFQIFLDSFSEMCRDLFFRFRALSFFGGFFNLFAYFHSFFLIGLPSSLIFYFPPHLPLSFPSLHLHQSFPSLTPPSPPPSFTSKMIR